MIEVNKVSKFYGTVPAIQDVSFSVEQGEIMGFLGPNGAGKTTTMRILTGFMPATSGTASVAGFDVFTHSLEARQRIGYLPEDVPLYKEKTVKEFLRFVADVKHVSAKDRTPHLAAIIDRCGLAKVEGRLIANLSKGFRQRVGLAQALVGDTQVLVLDEPTTGLDPAQIVEIRELIRELAEDKTIILSTHILPEVSMTCQRVIIINRGKIVAVDSTDNLTGRMQTSTKVLLEVDGPSDAVRQALIDMPGVLAVEVLERVRDAVCRYQIDSAKDRDLRQALAAQIVANGWGLLELRAVEMSLEDVFVQLVTEEDE